MDGFVAAVAFCFLLLKKTVFSITWIVAERRLGPHLGSFVPCSTLGWNQCNFQCKKKNEERPVSLSIWFWCCSFLWKVSPHFKLIVINSLRSYLEAPKSPKSPKSAMEVVCLCRLIWPLELLFTRRDSMKLIKKFIEIMQINLQIGVQKGA